MRDPAAFRSFVRSLTAKHRRKFARSTYCAARRYMCEVLTVAEKKRKALNGAKGLYNTARKLSEGLNDVNPIKLSLLLNFSVFHFEVMRDEKKAIKMARHAYERAKDSIGSLRDVQYQDSTLVMKMLKENVKKWRLKAPFMELEDFMKPKYMRKGRVEEDDLEADDGEDDDSEEDSEEDSEDVTEEDL